MEGDTACVGRTSGMKRQGLGLEAAFIGNQFPVTQCDIEQVILFQVALCLGEDLE